LWKYVIPHFEQFLSELELSIVSRIDGESKAERVARSLFADFYPNQTFDPSSYAIVGSYAKGTAARPRSDIDMIFLMPVADYPRYNNRSGNKQSQLLQDVKNSLLVTFPLTDIRGDGPVVKVPFSTYEFEVCPVFRWQDDLLINAHTRNGGRWGHTNPAAEINWLRAVDGRSHEKATQLVKMLKAWKRECNVSIRSICLETLAILFVDQWQYRDQITLFWHDWMIRDFFSWAYQFSSNGTIKPAGIDEWIEAGEWQTKCLSAYRRAMKACEFEHADQGILAAEEWRKVFGNQFKGGLLLPPSPLANLLMPPQDLRRALLESYV
jgi:hypothetical protein